VSSIIEFVKSLTGSNSFLKDPLIGEVEICILQGKLDDALKIVNESESAYSKVSNHSKQKLGKLLVQIQKSRIYLDMGKPKESLELLLSIVNEVQETKNSILKNLLSIETANAHRVNGNINEFFETIIDAEAELSRLKLFFRSHYSANAARIYNLKGKLNRSKGQFNEAILDLDASLKMYDKIGKTQSKAEPLNDIGITYASIGEMDKAVSYLNQSLSIYNELQNEGQLLKLYNNVGLINWQNKKLEDAQDNFNTALELSKKLNIKPYSATISQNLGLINLDQGEIAASRSNFETSLQIFEELDNRTSMAKVLMNLSGILEVLGELDIALDHLNRSLEIYQDIDSKDEIAYVYNNMGNIYKAKGDTDKALNYFNDSIEIFQSSGNILALINPLYGAIDVCMLAKKPGEAQGYLNTLEDINEQLEDNKSAEHMYKISKAKILVESDRVVQRAEAQKLFTEISDDEITSAQYTTEAMLRLGGLLLQELKLSASEDALSEFKALIDRLDKITRSKENISLTQYPVMVQVLLLRSKLALIDLKVEEAQSILNDAYDLANEHGLTQLASIVDMERDINKKELMKYKKMVETNASLYERLQETQIANYLKKAEEILKRK
jgi:tetratricopeptide (TPR) repeat protein